MTELIILDNTDVEVAALVDLDTFTPLLVAAAGPQRMVILRAFMDTTPFDLTALSAESIRAAFQSFLSGLADTAAAAEADAEDQVEPAGGEVTDAMAADALAGTLVPAGPSEPDPAASPESERGAMAVVRVRCWNCNGDGTVAIDNGSPVACNMCGGKGSVEQLAPSAAPQE